MHAAGLPFLNGEDWEIANVTGVHRTFIDLNDPKGRSHKQALGELRGKPCVCHVNPEFLGLVIGEGLEKVTKFARAWNVDGWSACGKSFLPHLSDAVGQHVEVVTILRDAGVTEEVDELARTTCRAGEWRCASRTNRLRHEFIAEARHAIEECNRLGRQDRRRHQERRSGWSALPTLNRKPGRPILPITEAFKRSPPDATG